MFIHAVFVVGNTARQVFRVGSLSLAMNHNVQGYRDLPNFPEVAPPGSVRDVEAKEVLLAFILDLTHLSLHFSSTFLLILLALPQQAAFWDSASSEPSPSSSKKGNLQVENLEDFLRDESGLFLPILVLRPCLLASVHHSSSFLLLSLLLTNLLFFSCPCPSFQMDLLSPDRAVGASTPLEVDPHLSQRDHIAQTQGAFILEKTVHKAGLPILFKSVFSSGRPIFY